MAENPKVSSKFDRSRGKGLKAPHISTPGGVAPIARQSVGLRKVDETKSQMRTTTYLPEHMAKTKQVSSKTSLMTDSIKQMKNKGDYP